MTYEELRQQVANHFVHTELVPFIPTAVALAEAVFNRRLRTREMQSRAYTTVSQRYLELPDDFQEVRSVYITGSWHRLEFLTAEETRRKHRSAVEAGTPVYYSIVALEMELLPAPADSLELEILYYRRIPALGTGRQTNWLIERHPDVYLYGVLLQAAQYLEGHGHRRDRRVSEWASMYQTILDEIHVDNERAEYPGGVLKARARPL